MRMAVRASLEWIGGLVLVGSTIMVAQAVPGLTEPVSARLAGSVTETAKAILPETSIDGPRIHGYRDRLDRHRRRPPPQRRQAAANVIS
jgi:hypothetical protein